MCGLNSLSANHLHGCALYVIKSLQKQFEHLILTINPINQQRQIFNLTSRSLSGHILTELNGFKRFLTKASRAFWITEYSKLKHNH